MSTGKGERGNKIDHSTSPERKSLEIAGGVLKTTQGGVNPEESDNERTTELATDQSIAARNLLYYPNDACLEVISKSSSGIGSIMEQLQLTANDEVNLTKDEILISMCTRLMADGGAAGIQGFNAQLEHLVNTKEHLVHLNIEPKDNKDYVSSVGELANSCRNNMDKIIGMANKAGPEGAVARQGILAFMGDLGGLEPAETGFGSAYKGPLCSPKRVYDTYVAGLCNAQRVLANQRVPATAAELTAFTTDFHHGRVETSLKGGGLSAPAHTAGKKLQRAPENWIVKERRGLLNTGDMAEEKLKTAYPQHHKLLQDASWPSYLVSEGLIQNVVEPVTGHVSGTFGEMATTMNLFCGTPPHTMTRVNPSGIAIRSAHEDQVTAIAALSAAGLISAGFHSAVEVFQPMSTFTTQATFGSMGPDAVLRMNKHANALRAYADEVVKLDENDQDRPIQWGHDNYLLEEHELILDKESLLGKAESIEQLATKSVDMISVLQGEGGTLASLEVSRVLANHSSNPKVPFKLYSLNTQLEELGLRGHTPELERVRHLAQQHASGAQEVDPDSLNQALEQAIVAAERREALHQLATDAEVKALSAENKLEDATELAAFIKSAAPDTNTVTFHNENLELEVLKAEAKAARKEAIAAKRAVDTIDKSVISAATKEAAAARTEAVAIKKELMASLAEEMADIADMKATKAQEIADSKQVELNQLDQEAPPSLREKVLHDLEVIVKHAVEQREKADNAKAIAINARNIARQVGDFATSAKSNAANSMINKENIIEKFQSLKEQASGIKSEDVNGLQGSIGYPKS